MASAATVPRSKAFAPGVLVLVLLVSILTTGTREKVTHVLWCCRVIGMYPRLQYYKQI